MFTSRSAQQARAYERRLIVTWLRSRAENKRELGQSAVAHYVRQCLTDLANDINEGTHTNTKNRQPIQPFRSMKEALDDTSTPTEREIRDKQAEAAGDILGLVKGCTGIRASIPALARALVSARDEHGQPNTFSPRELYHEHGAPGWSVQGCIGADPILCAILGGELARLGWKGTKPQYSNRFWAI